MTRLESQHASAGDAPPRIAVIGAGVPVGSGLIEALAPYESTVVEAESVGGALAAEAVAVVVVAAEPGPAALAVQAARQRSDEVPIVLVVPSLAGFDPTEALGAGATDLVSYSDASARPLALVVDASRRVQALRTRIGAVEREHRCREDVFAAWVSAEARTRSALREALAGMLAAVRSLRHSPGVHAADPVLLASMDASLERMQTMVDRGDREVPEPLRRPA